MISEDMYASQLLDLWNSASYELSLTPNDKLTIAINEANALEIEKQVRQAEKKSYDSEVCKLLLHSKVCNYTLLSACLDKAQENAVSSQLVYEALHYKYDKEIVLLLITHLGDGMIDSQIIKKAISKGYAAPEAGTRSVLYFMMQKTSEIIQKNIFNWCCTDKNHDAIAFCLGNFPHLIVQFVVNEKYGDAFCSDVPLLESYAEVPFQRVAFRYVAELNGYNKKIKGKWKDETAQARFSKLHNLYRKRTILYNGLMDTLSTILMRRSSEEIKQGLQNLAVQQSHCEQMLAYDPKDYDPEIMKIMIDRCVNKFFMLFGVALSFNRDDDTLYLILKHTSQTTPFELDYALSLKKSRQLIAAILAKLPIDAIDLKILGLFKERYPDAVIDQDIYKHLCAKASNNFVLNDIVSFFGKKL